MLNPANFREVVSGRKKGFGAALTRAALRIAEVPYTWAMRRRNAAFDSGRRPIERVAVPVISVGNLTLGGTGKTPLVEWIAKWYRQRGVRVTLISRGYGAQAAERNDEARELEQKLPDVPHLQNPDRVAAARTAIEEFECQLILLDDAFQHRRIARDLDIVLLDALEPFGFDHVFPRGTLREPLAGIARAQVAILTRADMVDDTERARIRGIVEKIAPAIDWAECRHAPQMLLAADGTEEPLAALRGQRVAAFCGLGNPAGFKHTLAECNYEVVAWREFPDHHNYTRDDVESLGRWATDSQAGALVCTHKDLVKLAVNSLAGKPLQAVRIGLEFSSGQAELETKLSSLRVLF